jgi:hypothetical protein
MNENIPPLVKWLRGIGAAALVLGIGAGMLPDHFLGGVVLCYAGFAALALDACFEPQFTRKRKLCTVAVILALAALFSWIYVFVPAPLDLNARATDGEFPAGTVISGISWKPEFTKLEVDISNPTDRSYEDLNLVLRPTTAVAEIAQSTNISDVTFEDRLHLNQDLLNINPETGMRRAIPLVIVATDAGYRVRCGRLSAHQDLRIVLALVDVKWNPSPKDPNGKLYEQARDPNYILRIKMSDYSTYWLGYKDGDHFSARPVPDWMSIEGTYLAAHRLRTVSQKVTIGGIVTIGSH